MILLDVKLNNIYGFSDFHMNFSYPKKIVNSIIDDEFLDGRPNFRYKKAIVLMGANATGKTTLGKALLNIFNFIDGLDTTALTQMAPTGKEGSFSVDFVSNGYTLHRVTGNFMSADEYSSTGMRFYYSSTEIGTKDSYETCAERLNKADPEELGFDGLNKFAVNIGKINYVFSCPEVKPSAEISKANKKTTLRVLKAVIGTLDPTLNDVVISKDIKNSFIIRRENEEIIIQDGKLLNREALSSGTAEGVDIAFFLSLILSGSNGFYYCDEHFSNIQSDIEKRIFGLMLERLGRNEQLIFTTYNSDMLDLNMPKHSFAFLRKRAEECYKVSVMFASEILKRNSDSVRCAFENDMFSAIPDDTLLDHLG